MRTFKLEEPVVMSPARNLLAGAGDKDAAVRIWQIDMATRPLNLLGKESRYDHIVCLAFARNGTKLAAGYDNGTVKVCDAVAGKDILELKSHRGYRTDSVSIAFSPDGEAIAAASGKTAKTWDAATGKQQFILGTDEEKYREVAYSPDGTQLATNRLDGTVMIWSTLSGHSALKLGGFPGLAKGLAFSPGGSRIAASSEDFTKVWDVQTGQEVLACQSHKDWQGGMVFSPDGEHMASADEAHAVQIWDAQTGHEVFTLNGHDRPVIRLAFHPDGKRLASRDQAGTVKIWDVATGHEVLTLRGPSGSQLRRPASPIRDHLGFSADGRFLMSSWEPGEVVVWDGAPVP